MSRALRPAQGSLTLRRRVAGLLRLAGGDLADAQQLAKAGSRNAAGLLRAAIGRMTAAVLASERGEAAAGGEAGSAAIDPRHPLKPRLQALEAALPVREPLRRDGSLAPASEGALSPQLLLQAGAVLHQLCAAFGVDRDGGEPAATAAPLRPQPQTPAPPPPAEPPPRPPPLRVVAAKPTPAAKGQGRGRRAAAPSPPPARGASVSKAPAVPAGLTSSAFWTLMDRWQVPDEPALELLGHGGGLTRTNRRPRFKLTPAEAETLQRLQSLDASLTRLAQDPAKWLRQPLKPAPFQGTRPLDWMLRHPGQGAQDLAQHLLQLALRASLKGGESGDRSPAFLA